MLYPPAPTNQAKFEKDANKDIGLLEDNNFLPIIKTFNLNKNIKTLNPRDNERSAGPSIIR